LSTLKTQFAQTGIFLKLIFQKYQQMRLSLILKM